MRLSFERRKHGRGRAVPDFTSGMDSDCHIHLPCMSAKVPNHLHVSSGNMRRQRQRLGGYRFTQPARNLNPIRSGFTFSSQDDFWKWEVDGSRFLSEVLKTLQPTQLQTRSHLAVNCLHMAKLELSFPIRSIYEVLAQIWMITLELCRLL